MTFLTVNENFGSNSITCRDCFIRAYDNLDNIIPVSFNEEPINMVNFNVLDELKAKTRCTTFRTLLESTIHGKTIMYGLLPNGADMLYLPDRGTSCDGFKVSNNDFECGAMRRFDMTFYTTNVYNYASFYASNPLDVMLRFKEKTGENMRIIYFSSPDIVLTLPLFNKKSYSSMQSFRGDLNEQHKIKLYEHFWNIIHTKFDMMVISNYTGWDRASIGENIIQNYLNNDSFQINFTHNGIKKIYVDKIYVNPMIYSPEQTWLNVRKYQDIEMYQTFKNFIVNNKLLYLLDKDVKMSDFKFSNIPSSFEYMIETFDPKDKINIVKTISNKGESVNLIYARYKYIFSNYKKVKNISEYEHLF
jgi:hypothetical protein